jgi:hypothetical protein
MDARLELRIRKAYQRQFGAQPEELIGTTASGHRTTDAAPGRQTRDDAPGSAPDVVTVMSVAQMCEMGMGYQLSSTGEIHPSVDPEMARLRKTAPGSAPDTDGYSGDVLRGFDRGIIARRITKDSSYGR